MKMQISLFLGAVALTISPAFAGANPPKASKYTITNLVSDQAGVAANTDSELVNPWGISHAPNQPQWVSDNGSNRSTVYDQHSGTKSLSVGVAGAPTGSVYVTPNSGFVVTEGSNSGSSEFLFDTEGGTILGWAPNVDFSNAIAAVDNSAKGSVYKGLAISGKQIFAADFANNQVQIYDSTFKQTGAFTDTALPKHFAPFNATLLGGKIYVAFAKREKKGIDELHGKGLGYVDVFDTSGNLQKRLISNGKLNAPWGMTIAPSGFGKYSGALLVGNFGDGKINAYDVNTGDFLGTLKGTNGKPVVIDGLWALDSGPDNSVTFTAGPDDETHGLLGLISLQ
jgi:uncharacterized protein (TIGR03118 family)